MRTLALLLLGSLTLAGSQGSYIGSQACARCHRSIYDSYLKTSMGRSAGKPDAGLVSTPISIHSGPLGRDFSVFRRGEELIQSESEERDGQTIYRVEHPLRYAVGAGENGISFAVSRLDGLFQAPLSYYSSAKRWDLSPGFEQAGEGFNRPILESCIVCHSGRPNAIARSEGRYLEPPFEEAGIGCENCHGPGQAHASLTPGATIVNPRRLPPRVAEDICMQCHQAGDARVLLPGKDYAAFRPGRRLVETLAIFSLASQTQSGDLLEHHSSMQSSRCFRDTNGKLSCLTCHDPHQQLSAQQAPAYFNQKCQTCHATGSCKASIVSRTATHPADNCINCHMPKRDVSRISHAALTNHRIPRRVESDLAAPSQRQWERPDLPGLRLMNNATPEAPLPLLTKLAAYGELMSRDRSLEPEYFHLLEKARQTQPDDELVLAALGRKALQSGSIAEAAELLAKAENKSTAPAVTRMDLSDALTRLGREPDAIRILERAQSAFPFNQAIRKRLILGQIHQKDYVKAREGLNGYVQDFPEDAFMRGLLSQVMR